MKVWRTKNRIVAHLELPLRSGIQVVIYPLQNDSPICSGAMRARRDRCSGCAAVSMPASEMEMRLIATEDMEIGEDLTPPLPPLSAALSHSLLSSHCSSCFSPLPSRSSHAPFFCSPACSATSALPLHLHPQDPDICVALRLRLLPPFSYSPSSDHHRIFGILANRRKLISSPNFSDKIKRGAMEISAAVGIGDGGLSLEEALMCLVITNSVEVQDETGRSLGIAVYGPAFSWINHSCSPNACYRFDISSPTTAQCSGQCKFRLAPGNECLQVTDFSRSHFRSVCALVDSYT